VIRSVRFLVCALAVTLTVATLAADPALAVVPHGVVPLEGASGLPASLLARHGLGARPPAPGVVTGVGARSNATTSPAALPVSVDLRKWAVTPGNQGQLNSCVPWVIDYAMLGWYSRFSGLAGQPFAPMYTYSQINGGGDYGSSAPAALDVAVGQGSDTRAHYTQGDYNWSTPPTAAERTNAARYKIKGYTTLFVGTNQTGTATMLKQALATNHPVAIEMAVRDGFDYIATSATSVDNDITSAVRGYHEVLAVGYDAAGLIVQNSWGTGWAYGGFGRISWRVVLSDVGEGETTDGFVQKAIVPTVSMPVAVRVSTVTATNTVIYRVTWKSAAGNTGAITRNDASYQVDGHPFVPVKLSSASTTTFRVTTVVGHHYRVAVRAVVGTSVGAWRYGLVFVA
jgi:hypothetical protein